MNSAAATDVDVLSKINVQDFPQSDWFVVTANDKIYVIRHLQQSPVSALTTEAAVLIRAQVTPPPGAVLVATLGSIQHLIIGFHFPDIILANGLSVISTKFIDPLIPSN